MSRTSDPARTPTERGYPARRRLTRRQAIAALAPLAAGLAAACVMRVPALDEPGGGPAAGEGVQTEGWRSLLGRGAPASADGQSTDSLTIALHVEPETLDPANLLTAAGQAASFPLFDRLVNVDAAGQILPSLAERWEVTPDGQSYLFWLRRDVSFHDGTKLDARVVDYSLQRFLGDEHPRRRGLLAGIVESVRVLDEHQLEIVLTRPFTPFLHQLAQPSAGIVSAEAHRRWLGGFGHHPVGSGPFRFGGWPRGNGVTLQRADGSWRGPSALTEARFVTIAEDSQRLRQLELGAVQVVPGLGFEALGQLEGLPEVALTTLDSGLALGVAINCQLPPFDSRLVRQALNFAVDAEALVEEVYGRLAVPLGGAVGPAVAVGTAPAPYRHDLLRARELLAVTGFDLSQELVLHSSRGRYPRDAALARAVQRQLQTLGLRVRLELLDGARYVAHLTRSQRESTGRLTLTGWQSVSGELRGALHPLFHSSQWMPNGQNMSFFRDQRVDGLLELANRSVDAERRNRLYAEAQLLLHDQAPWIFLVSPSVLLAHQPGLVDPELLSSGAVSVNEHTRLVT